MDVSSIEVRKSYHRFKINFLTKISECLREYSLLHWPENVAKICWFCINETADLQDTQRQDEIDPIIVRILERAVENKDVRDSWLAIASKDDEVNQWRACFTEERFAMLPDFNKFMSLYIDLLKINSAEVNNGSAYVIPEEIDLSAYPPFNDLAAKSVCSRESVWSDKGTVLIKGINHPDIACLVEQRKNLERKFNDQGPADKSITIQGRIILYHSSIVPEYVMEEIQRDPSISSKAVKAILYGFYCGFDVDSALSKYWKSDWVHAVTKLHPEVAEEPESFFKNFFTEEFDHHSQIFYQKIVREFGPKNLLFKIEGQLIPVHREVLKSYCNGLGPNYFSALFSGVYKEHEVIDLVGDLSGKLTYRGFSLQLMVIYQEKIDNPACVTFNDELQSAREFLFPLTEPQISEESKLIHKKSLRKLKETYKQSLFELHLQEFLKTKLTSNNPFEIAGILADFYVENHRCELQSICEMTFRVLEEKKIPILGKVEDLIKLVQQKAYPKLSDITYFSKKEQILYFRYMEELFKEEELSPYTSSLKEWYSLEGKKVLRKKAFDTMERITVSERPLLYHFNYQLIGLNRLLSAAKEFCKEYELTYWEKKIFNDMVKTVKTQLPILMQDSNENVDLKNEVKKNWKKLNNILGRDEPDLYSTKYFKELNPHISEQEVFLFYW